MRRFPSAARAVRLWTRAMERGSFDEAWRVADELLAARVGRSFSHLPRHEQPVWDGTPLAGRRVLVRCHHGLGDTLQFVRYVPLLRRIAREVTVWAQPELIPLLRTMPAMDRLLPLDEGSPRVDRDVDVEVMELPHVFRTTPATIPASVPYLHAAPAAIHRRGRLAVGLAWRGGDWDPRRSVSFSLLRPLGGLPGVDWHVLQRGAGLRERPAGWGVLTGADDPLETARVMRALDLVVSVDSMPAHLAGALGVPAWTLLPARADWRWMRDRDDSPWYPTMRLFRQARPWEWTPVIRRMARELQAVVAGLRSLDSRPQAVA